MPHLCWVLLLGYFPYYKNCFHPVKKAGLNSLHDMVCIVQLSAYPVSFLSNMTCTKCICSPCVESSVSCEWVSKFVYNEDVYFPTHTQIYIKSQKVSKKSWLIHIFSFWTKWPNFPNTTKLNRMFSGWNSWQKSNLQISLPFVVSPVPLDMIVFSVYFF